VKKDERAQLTPPPRVASSRGQGPGRRSAGPPPGQGSSGSNTWWIGAALLAVALVLVGAVSAFMLLDPGSGNRTAMPTAEVAPGDASPANAMERPVPVVAGSDPAPGGTGMQDTPSPRAAREQAYLRDEAGESLARVARQRERLEEQGVSIWGVEEMQRAAAGLAAADAAFTAGRYGEARDGYDAAGAMLDELGARAPRVQQQALADGEAALTAGRMTEAAAAFALALRVAPEDEQALAGLRSAENLDKVLALLNEGDGHERAGRLTEAEACYRQAASMDPGSQPTREALRRVRDRMRGEAMSAALSEGFAALEAGSFAAARAAFARAGSIAPDSPMVADGLARVDEAERLQRIAGHRKQAAVTEAGENWRAALAEHEAALAQDATLTFAQEGRERTAARAEMQEALAAYIASAARLGDDEVLREATALLQAARQVAPAGPRHLVQVEGLARLLDVMGRNLPVTLLSDGNTEITVYRVGRLGSFKRHDLELHPGTYTVVGQRDGYRDVRLTLTVKPGQAPAPLQIRCEDRL